jgi:diaminopimelate decarboxylase
VSVKSSELAHIVETAVREGVVNDETPLVGFIDFDSVQASVLSLQDAFPPWFVHTFAAKANPLVPLLQFVRALGLGCEAASDGEMALALAAGFAPSSIVYDAPTKTMRELERAAAAGVAINLDNLQEVARVAALKGRGLQASSFGLRVNTQVGAGSIASTSTATVSSKFGVPLRDAGAQELIVDCFRANPFLTRIHSHVGSQGCDVELLAEGVAAAFELAQQLNEALGSPRVACIDIGGGLPVNYEERHHPPRVVPAWHRGAADQSEGRL